MRPESKRGAPAHSSDKRQRRDGPAAIAVVGAPLGNAARSHKAACQEDPGHWVSVTDDVGVPTLELVGATVCTDAVTGQACTASQSTQPSPYPGWVQAVDDTGVPWLYPAGTAQTQSADCVQRNVTASVAAGSTAPAAPQSGPPPMMSPYPGWVVVPTTRECPGSSRSRPRSAALGGTKAPPIRGFRSVTAV